MTLLFFVLSILFAVGAVVTYKDPNQWLKKDINLLSKSFVIICAISILLTVIFYISEKYVSEDIVLKDTNQLAIEKIESMGYKVILSQNYFDYKGRTSSTVFGYHTDGEAYFVDDKNYVIFFACKRFSSDAAIICEIIENNISKKRDKNE